MVDDNIPDAINASVIVRYTQVPDNLLRNNEISAKAKVVLALLLSDRQGWKTCVAALCNHMKESETAIRTALIELEAYQYLKRIKYQDSNTKQVRGSFWVYTDVPGVFNLERHYGYLADRGMEPCNDWPAAAQSVEKPHIAQQEPKTPNSKNLLSDENSTQTGQPSTLERTMKYLPIAERLSDIIHNKKNIKHTRAQLIGWANEIRKLVELQRVSVERINTALNWYENNIGGQFVPVIESGLSLRNKFLRLETAISQASRFDSKPRNKYIW